MLSKTIKLGLALIVTSLVITGCASTSDTTDTTTTAPEPTASTEPTTTTPVQSSVVTLGTVVYFDFDQSEIKLEAQDLLTAHANELIANPRDIRLEGHADERGTREYNMALGERRANAVRDYLRLQGVNSGIEVISYGEEKPAALSSNEAAWSLNRRVELK